MSVEITFETGHRGTLLSYQYKRDEPCAGDGTIAVYELIFECEGRAWDGLVCEGDLLVDLSDREEAKKTFGHHSLIFSMIGTPGLYEK